MIFIVAYLYKFICDTCYHFYTFNILYDVYLNVYDRKCVYLTEICKYPSSL